MEKPTKQPENDEIAPPVQSQQIIQNSQNQQNQNHLQIFNQNNQLSNLPSNQRMMPNQIKLYDDSSQQINPPIPIFDGIQYIFINDPLTELNNCSSVLIKQEPEIIETITGCQIPNKYHVFGKTNNGYIYLFKCIEKSTFCMRCFCDPSLREFNIDVLHVSSGFENLFVNIYKPFKCVIGNFCERPEMIINLNNGENIGKILNPSRFCNHEYDVFDSNGQLKYFVIADCCQWALCCSNYIFGKCSKAEFIIFDKKFGSKIGLLTKNKAQCIEILTNANSFNIEFPISANDKEKLLLICLGLMIDYQHFEHRHIKKIKI